MKLTKCELSEATHLRSATGHVWGPGEWEMSGGIRLNVFDGGKIELLAEDLAILGIEPCKVKEPMRETFESTTSVSGGMTYIHTRALKLSWEPGTNVRVAIEEIPKKESE